MILVFVIDPALKRRGFKFRRFIQVVPSTRMRLDIKRLMSPLAKVAIPTRSQESLKSLLVLPPGLLILVTVVANGSVVLI